MENDPIVERQLQGHKSGITCVAFNPRDKNVASGDNGNVVMIWNLKKNASALKLQGHLGPVLDLNFSPKSNLLASASHDRTVRLWIPSYSGRSSDFRAHFSPVRSVHFSPDGEKLVTGSDDKSVKLWSVEGSRRFLASMPHHSNWVRCTRFSPGGTVIGSCSDDLTAILWDVRDTKKPVQKIEKLDSSPLHLAFQPAQESVFALACSSGHVRIYDMRSPKHLLQSYNVHTDHVNQIAFHPTGHLMLTASNDGQIKVLDLLEGRPIYTLTVHKNAVTGVAFSPAGHHFASVGEDRQVIIWKANDSCASPASAPRTPISGDPRSPVTRTNGWKKVEHPISSLASRNNVMVASTNGTTSNVSAETIKALEERVRRLEVVLQTESSSNITSAGDMPHLEKRIHELEDRILNNPAEIITDV